MWQDREDRPVTWEQQQFIYENQNNKQYLRFAASSSFLPRCRVDVKTH